MISTISLFFTWIGSSFIGALMNHIFTRIRDKKLGTNKLHEELIGVATSICFTLALQISELENLRMNILKRLEILKNKQSVSREDLISCVQDFFFFKEIAINIDTTNKFITPNNRGILEVLQSIFLSNKLYFDIINNIERFSEFKRSLTHDSSFFPSLYSFLESNFPIYLAKIDRCQTFAKRALESFRKILLENYAIEVPITMGSQVNLNPDIEEHIASKKAKSQET